MNQTSLDRKYLDLSEAATRCVLRYCQKFSREENFVVHKNREIKFPGSCIRANFADEWKFRFSILIKNNFIKWKERNGENEV